MIGMIATFAIQSLSLSRMAKEFDKYRQIAIQVETMKNIIKASAYEAIEPIILGNDSSFVQILKNQLKPFSATLKNDTQMRLEACKFFPEKEKHEINYELGIGKYWDGLLPQEKSQSNKVEIERDNNLFKYDLSIKAFPITNIDIVGYGLPASGRVSEDIPDSLVRKNGQGLRILTLTAANALIAGEKEQDFSFIHREAASHCWNLYEYIFSREYHTKLIQKEGTCKIDLANEFQARTAPEAVEYKEETKTYTIDLGKINSNVLGIIDPMGYGSVEIKDRGGYQEPLVITVWSRNPQSKTKLKIMDNKRPIILYAINTHLDINEATINGAVFIGKGIVCTGTAVLNGHLSYYGEEPEVLDNFIVRPSESVKKEIVKMVPLACEINVEKRK